MPLSAHEPWSLRGGFPRAVIFLHGILGSPAQFRALGAVLHAAGWDCEAALLPGHGGSPDHFAATRSAQWQAEAMRLLAEAADAYELVVVFAHSMGCLLALQAAVSGARVAGLVLLCPALLPKLSPRQARYALRTLFAPPRQDDATDAAYRAFFSVERGAVLGYARWALPLLSLTRLSRATRRIVGSVRCPVLVLQPTRDESVRRASARFLQQKIRGARVVWLPRSGHMYFAPEDAERIGEETLLFLSQIKTD